ncbi:nucleoid-associated protein [Bacillus sp. M6-12]|uniref:nucleoid-associated protein n=1 Tax=Bacillus sp. M6-12 TaxID=2054166 RepID=UPI0015E1189F|nr:nucleoid-associated protein [Bacillus sp. M6-12]
MATIHIKKVIAHHLDLNLSEPTCVDSLVDLSKPELTLLVNFFEKHIKNALNESRIKPCIFEEKTGDVYTHSLKLYKQMTDENFINSSQILTKRLHGFMKTTSSKSSGALIFILYQLDSKYSLAIMKMDPNEGVEFDPINVTFTVRKNMLPDTREKLHKSAFILLDDLENVDDDIHLYVLDKQQKADTVSKFFLQNFLQAKEKLNHEKIASLFEETVLDYASEHLNPFVVKRKLDKVLIEGAQINVDTALEDLFREFEPGEENRKQMIESVKDKMRKIRPDSFFEFKIQNRDDANLVLTSKDSNISVRFPESLFEKSIFVEISDEDSEEKYTIIKIEGERLKIKTKLK